MDPITIAIGVAGLATSLFGGAKASGDAKQAAQISGQITGVEQQENTLRNQMMNFQGRRAQLENLRNSQRARAQAVQAGVSGNASYGSGVQGGIASVENQGLFNMQGVNANIAAGNQFYGYNTQISGLKQHLSQVQGQEATDQGIASLGGSVMKAAPMLGALGQQASGFGSQVAGLFSPNNTIFG